MNLKNYTSGIPASQTIAFIEAYLADAGVTNVMKDYIKGQPIALTFAIEEDGQRFAIRLPANVQQVQDVLYHDYMVNRKRGNKTKEDFLDQATRTAWKIQRDWVEVQMALVKLKQAKVLQVFLGYVWDGKRSYFEHLEVNKFKALPENT